MSTRSVGGEPPRAAGRRAAPPRAAGVFAVGRLRPGRAHAAAVLVSVTRTDDELFVICPADDEPGGRRIQPGWRGLQVAGPLDFALTGVAAALTAPLASAEVSVLPVATFDTDYLFVRADSLDAAVGASRAAGHTVGTES